MKVAIDGGWSIDSNCYKAPRYTETSLSVDVSSFLSYVDLIRPSFRVMNLRVH
jgi:hypothetical protein